VIKITNFILGYGHWKSKALIKRALKDQLKPNDKAKKLNSKDPKIDFIDPRSGRWGTPEEIRKHTKKNTITFTNKKRSFYGNFKYNEKTKTWSVT